MLRSAWLRSPWLLAGIVLLVAFVALGFYSQSIHDALNLKLLFSSASTIERELIARSIFGTVAVLPELIGLVMLWVAFLSPRWSDKYLWSAAMIFTGLELSADAHGIFARTGWSGVQHTYPSPYAVTGLIAYGTWLLILAGSAIPLWRKRVFGTLCIIALLFIVSYPLIDPYVSPIDIAGSVLFAAACFAFGVFVAARVGVNLFLHDERVENHHE